MEKMKKEGKIRFSGFSSHSRMAPLLREAAQCGYHDVALVSYNFTHSKELKEAVAMAAKAGVGIVAMKTQAGGYTKEKMEGLNPHQAASMSERSECRRGHPESLRSSRLRNVRQSWELLFLRGILES
jgi:predicted aldo/keto reductase-like oxidoreductase